MGGESLLHDLKKANERICQLEKQCAVLAAEVDAQRPVVEVAITIAGYIRQLYGNVEWAKRFQSVVAAYQASNPK